MLGLGAAIAAIVLAGLAATPERVSFPTQDGGVVCADLYGKGGRSVVLAHGGRFNKESWEKQVQPLGAPLHFDVLAAVRYLRQNGAKTVSVIGGSMGGGAAADASVEAEPGEIDRLVLLGSTGGGKPEKLKGREPFLSEGARTGCG